MTIATKIRPIQSSDIDALKAVIEANQLFPSEMLDEMISPCLNHENTVDYWLTYEEEQAIAIAYVAPEKMTEGTWNLYLIAVHPDYQGQGIGSEMLQYIEKMLAEQGERILLVETSALPSYQQTRNFYHKCGYEQEARIRDFYQAGEDKIIFRKSLNKN